MGQRLAEEHPPDLVACACPLDRVPVILLPLMLHLLLNNIALMHSLRYVCKQALSYPTVAPSTPSLWIFVDIGIYPISGSCYQSHTRDSNELVEGKTLSMMLVSGDDDASPCVARPNLLHVKVLP